MNDFSIAARRQHGAALVTALVMMTIMTLLAITSMSTNTLEEKMAANSQEVNRAFQTAETGLARILADDNAFDTANSVDDNGTPFNRADDVYDYVITDTVVATHYSAQTRYTAEYRQQTPPKRGSGWDTSMSFYHFDLGATGATNIGLSTASTGVSTALHAGAYQVAKK